MSFFDFIVFTFVTATEPRNEEITGVVVISVEQREEKFEITDQQQHSKSEVADKCQHLKTEVAEETQEELQSKQSQLVLPKISESTTTHVADSTTKTIKRYQGNYLCKTLLSRQYNVCQFDNL